VSSGFEADSGGDEVVEIVVVVVWLRLVVV
jgi:hypothetical protein